MSRSLNFLLYQIGWFACVWGAASSHAAIGITVAVGLVVVHMILTTQPMRQAKLLAAGFAIGLAVDTALLAVGVCRFPGDGPLAGLPPVWMSVLWIQFATTLRYAMRWTSGRYTLSAVLGLGLAPLAFLGGERMGAMEFLDPRILNVAILGLFWSAAMPLLVSIGDRLHADETPAGYRWFDKPDAQLDPVNIETERL